MKHSKNHEEELEKIEDPEDIPEFIEKVSGIKVREQAPHYLGARMGRPEKAERRTIEGKPQLLFPCGKEEGGRMRNLVSSYQEETVKEDIIHNKCPECQNITHYNYCPDCGIEAEPIYFCTGCSKQYDEKPEKCSKCGSNDFKRHKTTEINVKEMMDKAMENLGKNQLPELLKSVRGMSSKNKDVEPLEKGLIREEKDLYVNKDGTVRYDASDLPMTHFKPEEINVSVEKLREIGYTEDINGEPLEKKDQVLELKPQDIIIPDGDNTLAASDYMMRVADFIDKLLEEFYDLEPYYNVEEKEDLVGELIIGLAPHTSGGTVGRIIGFTDAKGIYAHPYWHAAKRRNCLPGDTEVKTAEGETKELRKIFQEADTPREADKTGTVEKSIDLEVQTEEKRQITTSKATKVIKTPAQEFKIIFQTQYGRKHEVFPDHKVKTSEGVKRARNVDQGDKLLVKAEIEDDHKLEAKTHKDTKTTQKQLKVLEEEIINKKIEKSQERFMYDLEVENTHNFITHENIITSNCDGDEDAILLMMDGLLNFSRQFLPDVRGARTMDAPLILSTVINADEVDDEAWAIETVDEYPLGFYEETQEYKKPWELENEIEIGEDIVHSDEPFRHGYTHESDDVENGPTQSEYVTLNEMSEKTSSQLE
ncbi:MAG: DNA polymerase II large subunit, partial [Candidatus Nanohaloarchaea archaeon]